MSSLLIACSNEDLNENNFSSPTIETRSRSLGVYTVENGRVKFNTTEEFMNTIKYLQNATEVELNTFRNSISIETPAKSYMAFSNAIDDENLTKEELDSIEQQYASKLKITLNGEGEKEVNLKFDIDPEFINLNGEYQVGQTIIKQVGTKLVSITKPSLVAPSSVDEYTTTNEASGVYVTETVMAAPTGCCPTGAKNELNYNDGKKKKVIASYDFKNLSSVHDLYGGWKLVFPRLQVIAEGTHKKRKCFIFCWWSDEKTSIKHDWYANFSHTVPGLHLPNPYTINSSESRLNESSILFKEELLGQSFSILTTLPISYNIGVCVHTVRQVVTANNRTVTNICN